MSSVSEEDPHADVSLLYDEEDLKEEGNCWDI
jgi:hypothetical protein